MEKNTDQPVPAEETAKKLNLTKSRTGIQQMFDEVAPTYDFLNHLLSMGIDNYWRAVATARAKKLMEKTPDPRILDVATGTGDLAVLNGENTRSKSHRARPLAPKCSPSPGRNTPASPFTKDTPKNFPSPQQAST